MADKGRKEYECWAHEKKFPFPLVSSLVLVPSLSSNDLFGPTEWSNGIRTWNASSNTNLKTNIQSLAYLSSTPRHTHTHIRCATVAEDVPKVIFILILSLVLSSVKSFSYVIVARGPSVFDHLAHTTHRYTRTHTAPSMRVDLFWFYGNWNGVNAHRFIIQIERICHFVSQLNRGFSIITKYSSFESKTYRLRCAERPIHTRTHFDFGCCFFFHYYDSSLFKYAKCDFVYEYTREI